MKRKALLTSVLALLLCVSMLVGTTFAWFTDSVSNGVNKIVSGNLDVELWHKTFNEAGYMNMNDYAPVEADTELFLNIDGEEILWEPGACADEYFKVTNNGSLALKYKFTIDFANATETPEGKTLADVLSIYAVYRDFPNMNDSPVEGYDQVALKNFEFESYLLPGESHEFQIGVEWKSSDVDNEFNVKGGLSIDLGVTLVATQYTYEKDATGDQYDVDAEYPTVALPPITTTEQLQDAFAKGGNFVLGADIVIPGALEVPAGTNISIDMAGYDFIAEDTESALVIRGDATLINTANDDSGIFVDSSPAGKTTQGIEVKQSGTLTIADGAIKVGGDGNSIGILNYGVVNVDGGVITVTGEDVTYGIFAYNGVVNMNGGEIVVTAPAAREAYAIQTYNSATINLNAGKISVQNAGTYHYAVFANFGTADLNIANGFELDVAAGAHEYGKDTVATLNVA